MTTTPVADAALFPAGDEDQTERVLKFGEATPQLVPQPARRGRPPVADPKPKVTIRLPRKTLEALRQSGRGWQTRLAQVAGEMVAAGQPAAGDGVPAASVRTVADTPVACGPHAAAPEGAEQPLG